MTAVCPVAPGSKDMEQLGAAKPKSTYSLVNDTVYPNKLKSQVEVDETFYSWVARRQLYFGELMKPEAAAAVSKLVRQSTPESRVKLLDTFRKMHATSSIRT
jgi:hypothetical protein